MRKQLSTLSSNFRDYFLDRRKLSPVLLGVVGVFSLSVFGSYVGLHLKDIGTTQIIIGVILAMRNIYQLFLRVPLSDFSQKVGRKPLLFSGLFCYSLALFTLFLANHWILVFIATTLLALGMSSFWPALISYIADVEKDNVGKLQGRTFQGTDMGSILGSLVAYLLIKLLKFPLQNLFGITALASFIAGILLFFYVPESLDVSIRSNAQSKIRDLLTSFKSMFSSLAIVSKQRSLMIVYFYQIVLAFLEYFMTAFFPFLITTSVALGGKGMPYETVALIMWINSGVLIFFKPLFGRIIDKFGFKLPITITLSICAVTIWSLVVVNSLVFIVVIYLIYSAATLTSYIATNSETTRRAKVAQRGLAVGALGFYLSAGRSLSTLVLSPVWRTLGIALLFKIAASIVAVFLIILSFLTWMANPSKETAELKEKTPFDAP
ncbi:MAG: MFS transporter [Candidatus Heimdallarchaeum aukensis]|uniref:MFS transporter n=1 Tax=Candidatus Heimdallarchaeum aukensis TaxID=2876573 RepID=A0A9Y1BK12_9ARCH|nr:MAG: MFS transporter [Candidatus Heimdallarchaeum aukensis]